MKKVEFQAVASVGGVDDVVLTPSPDSAEYQLWAQCSGSEAWKRIAEARGEPKAWTSLDRAVAWIRANGYAGKISIQASGGR